MRVVTIETLGDRVDRRGIAEHADLHRSRLQIGKHRVDLRGDEVRRHVMDRGNAFGVLRRQRGNDGCAIDAER